MPTDVDFSNSAEDSQNRIYTFTGRLVDPFDLKPQDISLQDIAWSLANKVRFTGHCVVPYTVAEHSIIVSGMVPPEDALWGLLHDAAEAYISDIAKPLKKRYMIYYPACGEYVSFSVVEEEILGRIGAKFGLSLPIPQSVHDADKAACVEEMKRMMCQKDWIEFTKENDRDVDYMSHSVAYFRFMQRYLELV